MLTEMEKKISVGNKEQIEFNLRLLHLVDTALGEIDRRKKTVQSLTPFEGIILMLFARCRKQFEAIQTLCNKGYGEDAGLVLRSMINALIDVYYIKTDQVKLAERYLRFDFIIREKKLDMVKKFSSSNSLDLYSKKATLTEKKILEEVKQFNKDFPKGNRVDWSGLNIKLKAEKAKGYAVDIYETAYKYYSDFEHNNIMSLYSHINNKEKGKFIVLCEPNENQIERNLGESLNIFRRLFNIFRDTFKLNCDPEIKKLCDEYDMLLIKKLEASSNELKNFL